MLQQTRRERLPGSQILTGLEGVPRRDDRVTSATAERKTSPRARLADASMRQTSKARQCIDAPTRKRRVLADASTSAPANVEGPPTHRRALPKRRRARRRIDEPSVSRSNDVRGAAELLPLALLAAALLAALLGS